MKLIQLIKNINDLEVIGDNNINIKKISKNSNEVESVDLFIAIKGVKYDGHDFITDVIKKGVKCIVCEEIPLLKNKNITFIKTKSSKDTYSKICCNFFNNPSTKLNLIGVTGTNGKTSSTTLLYEMFSLNNILSGLISTNKIVIKSKHYKTNLTTPDAYDLNFFLNEMVKMKVKFCFMEVSSHSIDQYRISGLTFSLGVFTNISHDHLNYHKSFKNYLNVKKRFFDYLGKESNSLINKDDKNSNYIIQNTKSKVFEMSLKMDADFKLKILENSFNGLILKINNKEVSTKLIGRFNAYNLLTVYSVSKLYNIDFDEILVKMSMLKNPNGRFDVIIENQVIGIIDYAHTPDALLNVLETINEIKNKDNSIITVVGCGGGRDKLKRLKMGKIASKLSSTVIFTSDNPRDEEPESIINDMICGVEKEDKSKVISIVDRNEAIIKASNIANPNDVLLVAGKGHEDYQIIKSKKIKFNDKEILIKNLKIAV